MATARTRSQRRRDALATLTEVHADAWVASSSRDGVAHLVPLSYAWDGVCIIVVSEEASLTTRNIRASGRARIALGGTRDVVMVDALLEAAAAGEVEMDPTRDVYARQAGWDPRDVDGDFAYLRLRPQRIQVWREANEITGRTVMRDGLWID
jgi:hypothetical protein